MNETTAGVATACYHPVHEGVSVGIAVEFPKGQEVTGLEDELLRANPGLTRTRGDHTLRAYHPCRMLEENGLKIFEFVRWLDWDGAESLQLVLRRKAGTAFAVCARFGEDHAFGFERPAGGRFTYTNLDLLTRTQSFNPLYIRVGSHPGPYTYLRLEAELDEDDGTPIVTVQTVNEAEVPTHLLPRR